MQAIVNGNHAFVVSGNGWTYVQEMWTVDTVNSNRYYGRNGATIVTGGLAIDDGGVKITGVGLFS